MNHLIFQSGKSAYLPSDLGECDQRQYIEISALVLKYNAGQITYEDFRVLGLYALLNMVRKESPFDETNKMANVYRYSELLDSFWDTVAGDDREPRKVIRADFNHNPIPSVFGICRKLYGPSDAYDNMTWGEYIDALSNFMDFHDTGDIFYLYRLAAVFYRPRKLFRFATTDDVRVVYNPFSVDRRAKVFERHHIGVAYGIYLFFAAMQKYVSTAKLYVMGKEIDLSVLYDATKLIVSKQKESNLPGLGLKGLEYTIAESGIFGDVAGVRRTKFWEIYLRLHDIVKKDQDILINQDAK